MQVDAYGGVLSYGIRYRLGRGPPEPTSHPDVVLRGHGRQLRARAGATQPDVPNRRHLPLTEVGGRWRGEVMVGGDDGGRMMGCDDGDAGAKWLMMMMVGGVMMMGGG